MYFYLAFIVFSFVYSMVVLPLFKEPMIIKSIQIMSQKSLIKSTPIEIVKMAYVTQNTHGVMFF